MSHRIVVLAAVLALLGATALFSGSALAAKGGHGGGGKGHGSTATGTCSVNPNPVAQMAFDTISGSGFVPNTSVGYTITGSGGTAMGFAVADGTGNFSTISQAVWLGTNTVYVSGGRVTATCTFQVY